MQQFPYYEAFRFTLTHKVHFNSMFNYIYFFPQINFDVRISVLLDVNYFACNFLKNVLLNLFLSFFLNCNLELKRKVQLKIILSVSPLKWLIIKQLALTLIVLELAVGLNSPEIALDWVLYLIFSSYPPVCFGFQSLINLLLQVKLLQVQSFQLKRFLFLCNSSCFLDHFAEVAPNLVFYWLIVNAQEF